jgi:murein DD-endopeptidase MepM/ murein hydrolase activator NlpD
MRGFGYFIVLRHGKTVTTAYGHLDGFAEGLKKGDAIHQGDVIGFVGQTGWATGPHLHYEFRINGVHKDPLTADVTTALAPGSPQLAEFRARVASLRTPLASGSRADLAFLD